MPDDKAQVILRNLVDRYGPFSSSADDLRRCRGFLLDLAGSHKLEINLILRALESGAPEQLTAGHTNLGLVTPRLARELQETHGISAENAAWSVAAWVFALSLKPAVAEPAHRWQMPQHLQQLGIEMIRIPAGEFLYGDDQRRIDLDEFWIAKTPVTNRQYKAFVDATGHSTPEHWQTGKIPVGKEDHPVVYVSWNDATAFCQWAGVMLPTEQQWEKAARGMDGRTFPWGDAVPDKHRCNFNNEVGDTTPVGKYPAGANGLFDMAGNAWEWCDDWYEQGRRVMRGGAWYIMDRDWMRCAFCGGNSPGFKYVALGFRVVSPDLAATAVRAAEEKRRQEAAELERQRAEAAAELERQRAEAAHRQQCALNWQQVRSELVQIPAGEFLYGDDERRVYLPEYWIAKTPVTNWQYKAFVDATGHRAPLHWRSSRIPAGKEDHPVVSVSWHDAAAFCQWAGVALPSEQQWEKAARGMDGRKYPWGAAEPDKHRCNFNRNVGDTTPVGKYPAGANDLFDMAGNVWEWCVDWYGQGGRVMRGGSWLVSARWVRCAYRDWSNPGSRYDSVGFRVVSPGS